MRAFVIAGTRSGVGKTTVTLGLPAALVRMASSRLSLFQHQDLVFGIDIHVKVA